MANYDAAVRKYDGLAGTIGRAATFCAFPN
jgi:hypothetical protein